MHGVVNFQIHLGQEALVAVLTYEWLIAWEGRNNINTYVMK
jgi:hypothetical protein